jgi:hypothetical protein
MIFHGNREIPEIRGQIRSFFHPGTGPGAAGPKSSPNERKLERRPMIWNFKSRANMESRANREICEIRE